MSEQHQLLSTRQAATLLGVSVRTIQLWVEQGLLSAWKTPGGHRRIVQESLLQLLHKRHGAQPLTFLLCVGLPAELSESIKLLCHRWNFPVELQHARNAVDALLTLNPEKTQLMLTMADLQGVDLDLLQQELKQQQVQLALFCPSEALKSSNQNLIWLKYPLDPYQLKTELQKLLFARLQQAS